ncbi:sulfatase-like hydrolase/transferase, partial [Chloroflexota bacterium]
MPRDFSRREIIKLASLLSMTSAFPALLSGPERIADNPDAQNVLIVVFDTMSSKHLSLYGYQRDTTPNLNRIAERGFVYRNHYASAEFTTPGTASLLTGVYPFTHRAIQLDFDLVAPEFERQNIFTTFDDYHRTAYSHNRLANALLLQFQQHLEGYKDRESLFLKSNLISGSVFSKDSDAALLSWSRVLTTEGDGYSNSLFISRIMEDFDDLYVKRVGKDFPRGVPHNHGDYFLLEAATDWMQEQIVNLPQPFLGYFHMLPPHAPYLTRKDFHKRFLNDGYQPIDKPEHY